MLLVEQASLSWLQSFQQSAGFASQIPRGMRLWLKNQQNTDSFSSRKCPRGVRERSRQQRCNSIRGDCRRVSCHSRGAAVRGAGRAAAGVPHVRPHPAHGDGAAHLRPGHGAVPHHQPLQPRPALLSPVARGNGDGGFAPLPSWVPRRGRPHLLKVCLNRHPKAPKSLPPLGGGWANGQECLQSTPSLELSPARQH